MGDAGRISESSTVVLSVHRDQRPEPNLGGPWAIADKPQGKLDMCYEHEDLNH